MCIVTILDYPVVCQFGKRSSIFVSPPSSVCVTDHSTGYEHADTTSAVGLSRQQAPDRIHPQPCQPEGL